MKENQNMNIEKLPALEYQVKQHISSSTDNIDAIMKNIKDAAAKTNEIIIKLLTAFETNSENAKIQTNKIMKGITICSVLKREKLDYLFEKNKFELRFELNANDVESIRNLGALMITLNT